MNEADFRIHTLPIPHDLKRRVKQLASFSEWRIYSEQPLIVPAPAFHDGIEPRFVWDDLWLVPMKEGHEVADSIRVTVRILHPTVSEPPIGEVDEARHWAAHFDDGESFHAIYHEMVRQQHLDALFFIDEECYAHAIVNARDLNQFDLFRTAYMWLAKVIRPKAAIADYANWTPSGVEDQVLAELSTASSVLEYECMKYLSRHPDAIPQIHPRKFESLVASVLRHRGYDVQLTPASWDGGKDIIVLTKDDFGPIVTVVDCKRYRDGHRVGVRHVREILGVAAIENANRAAIVTTSTFTREAYRLSAEQKGRLSLIDRKELERWLVSVAEWRVDDRTGLLSDQPNRKTRQIE
ncbi:MAG: restriction endonuclease [bacterium]|jgi:hypothetical protein